MKSVLSRVGAYAVLVLFAFIAQLIGTINAMNAQIASAAEEQTAVAEEIKRLAVR